MVHRLSAAALAAVLCSPLSAAVLPSPAIPMTLEQSLQTLRARIAAAKSTTPAEITDVDNDVRAITRAAWRLRPAIQDLGRRARLRRVPGNPNSDPFFPNDLQRLAYTLRQYAQACAQVDGDATRLAQGAQKDPALVAAADALLASARALRSEAQWLGLEARNGAWDLRMAGYPFEATTIQNAGLYGVDASREIADAAAELADKVKP